MKGMESRINSFEQIFKSVKTFTGKEEIKELAKKGIYAATGSYHSYHVKCYGCQGNRSMALNKLTSKQNQIVELKDDLKKLNKSFQQKLFHQRTCKFHPDNISKTVGLSARPQSASALRQESQSDFSALDSELAERPKSASALFQEQQDDFSVPDPDSAKETAGSSQNSTSGSASLLQSVGSGEENAEGGMSPLSESVALPELGS